MNNNGNEFMATLLILAAGAFAVYIAAIVAIYLLFFLTIFAVFVAFAWSFVCLIAWFFPFNLGPIYLDSESARAFIVRGIYGAIILPGFFLFADVVLDVKIHWQYLHLYMVLGYTLLSVGLGYLFAGRANIPHVYYDAPPQHYRSLPAQPKQEYLPPPPNKPRYASWDDEEEFR